MTAASRRPAHRLERPLFFNSLQLKLPKVSHIEVRSRVNQDNRVERWDGRRLHHDHLFQT